MNENSPPVDHIIDDGRAQRPVEEHLKSRATWMRALYMAIAAVLISLASAVGCFVVLLGFFWVLFTGEVNTHLRSAGQMIADYVYQIIRFLTFNTEDRPFPLGGDWPSPDDSRAG